MERDQQARLLIDYLKEVRTLREDGLIHEQVASDTVETIMVQMGVILFDDEVME